MRAWRRFSPHPRDRYSSLGGSPKVLELNVEKNSSTTYFHVRLESPADLIVQEPASGLPWQIEQWEPARLPHLVPQDDKTWAVYLHWVDKLEFYGKVKNNAKARLLLLYPTKSAQSKPLEKMTLAELLNQKTTWAEVPLTLDFSKATKLEGKPPVLERKWAGQQARFFAKLETQTPEFGFYGFARELTAQKYGVEGRRQPGQSTRRRGRSSPDVRTYHRRHRHRGIVGPEPNAQRQYSQKRRAANHRRCRPNGHRHCRASLGEDDGREETGRRAARQTGAQRQLLRLLQERWKIPRNQRLARPMGFDIVPRSGDP